MVDSKKNNRFLAVCICLLLLFGLYSSPSLATVNPGEPCGHGIVPPICSGSLSLDTQIKALNLDPPKNAPDSSYCYPNNDSKDAVQAAAADTFKIVSTVLKQIKDEISSMLGKALFDKIVGDQDFKDTVIAVIVLYLVIYGIMIWFNLAPATAGEVIIRLVKIAIVVSVTSETGWQFLMDYFGNFFLNGMDDIINFFTNAGDIPGGNAPPGTLVGLDNIITTVFSQHFLVMMAAVLFTGPYGIIVFLFLSIGLLQFIFSIIGALITYVRAVVGLNFLFALSPIFICFSLFSKTRGIFGAWIEQIVAFFLQPIFIFAFFGVFVSMMNGAVNQVLLKDVIKGSDPFHSGEEYCWVPVKFFTGYPIGAFSLNWYAGAVCVGTDCSKPEHLQIYTGPADKNGPSAQNDKGKPLAYYPGGGPLPINLNAAFFFILWAFLSFRYIKLLTAIVQRIVENSINLETTSKEVKHWLKNSLGL